MRMLACCLIPAALLAAPVRVARLGELEGKVEIQLHAADSWRPAVRNLPLVESAWVRTAAGARVEMELDDGSVLRLAGDALCELSDYKRLSTGQLVTILSLDHGTAYYTGQPERRDAFILVVPGAQATIRTGTRVRLDAHDDRSQIAVLEGQVRFSSPAAELDLPEGQTATVQGVSPARFFLNREISPVDTDLWNEQRDKALTASGSLSHLPRLQYGLVDLDANGSWMQTNELGVVWKPKVAAGWTPYRDGQWLWYDELGYAWIANEPWGWLPFHYGRWTEQSGLGWVWSPGTSVLFKPGEVYWLRQASILGWGPLAPGESWDARAVPRQYLRANTTLAKWQQDIRELIPAETAVDKLKAAEAVFVVAPPSPAMDSARLDIIRPVLRAGSTRVVPMLAGVTYEPPNENPQVAASEPPPPQMSPDPGNAPQSAGSPPPVYGPVPVPEPDYEYYPAAIYTGIVVVNPRENDRSHRQPVTKPAPGVGMPRGDNARQSRDIAPVHRPETPANPAASAPPPRSVPQPASELGMPRGDNARDHREVPPPVRIQPAPRAAEPAHPAQPSVPAPAARPADPSAPNAGKRQGIPQ